MARIVLAHGILGFGSIFPDQSVNYFNGIKNLYQLLGHDVVCPTVPALGSLAVRAAELECEILEKWPDNSEPLFALAHSMGGLDCRRLIATSKELKGKFKRLITIATPHFGSPVADIVLNPPEFLGVSLVQWLVDFFAKDAGALNDLKARQILQDQTAEGVEYLCIGCDSSITSPHSTLFAATWLACNQLRVLNDGVVSLDSASITNNASDLWRVWPLDHGGAIGWPTGGVGHEFLAAINSPPQRHLDRYKQLLPDLIK